MDPLVPLALSYASFAIAALAGGGLIAAVCFALQAIFLYVGFRALFAGGEL